MNNLLNSSKDKPRGRGRAACGIVRVDQAWECPEERIVDDGGRNGHGGWMTCGEQKRLNVSMPSGFAHDVEPPPKSATDESVRHVKRRGTKPFILS